MRDAQSAHELDLGVASLLFGMVLSGASLRLTYALHRLTGPQMIDLRKFNTLLLVGLVAGGALALAGLAVFPPVAILGIIAVLATVVSTTVLHARASGKWALMWLVVCFGLVWAVATAVAWNVWGVEFNLTDADKDIPTALSLTMRFSVVLGLVGFVGLVISSVLGIRGARRSAVRTIAV